MTYGYEPREESPAVPVPAPRHWADGAPSEPPWTPPRAAPEALGGPVLPARPVAPPGQPDPVAHRYPTSAAAQPGLAAPVSAQSYGAQSYGGQSDGGPAAYAGQSYGGQSTTDQGGGYRMPYSAPYPPQSAPPAVSGGPLGAVPSPRRRRAWPGIVALLLVVGLSAVAGFQAYQIDRLAQRLAAADRRLADDGTRLDDLEKRAGDVFNPEGISTAVLPSVLLVRAGRFTGTAFAVGKPVSGGGTNLFTNWHVIKSVWDSGGRKVFLERTGKRYPATIVKVDKANDVAHLRTAVKFTGLGAASAAVKSGQQIVVVGAPLGLEDSVTTGVVSAQRKVPETPGTMIQFDAPINPGNSGGPVVNGAKQVIGIATAKRSGAEGIALAVPIKTACDKFKIC